MRKEHVDGLAAMAAAEAFAAAARTPGATVRLVDGSAVLALGDASQAEMEDFASWAFGPEAERMIAEAALRPGTPAKRAA